MFDVEFYTLPDGRKPVEEFLNSLPDKMRIKAIDSLDLLEEYGNQLRKPYSKAIKELYFDKAKGIITEAEYLEFSKEFSDKKKGTENLIQELKETDKKLDDRIKSNDNRQKIIEEYTNIERLDREIVQKLIDHICVGKRIKGSQDVPVEIHWNF